MTFVPNPTPDGEHYRISRSGAGGFLCPPGHPNLTHSVTSQHSMMSLETAAEDESVPTEIRQRAQKILDAAQLIESDLWVMHTYSYFRNCYSPDGVDRSTQNCLIIGQPRYSASEEPVQADDPRVAPEHHLGYLMVKKYFPEHEVRLDLLDSSAGYGSRPCRKCGTTLQYEAKVDRFAEAITCKLDCKEGGEHS